MGPWTYYAPLWLGTLVSAGVYISASEGPIGLVVIVSLLRAVLTGLSLQLVMIGLQGLFARVVPVPVGRSLRGGIAQVVGGLILVGEVIGLLAVLHIVSNMVSPVIVYGASSVCMTMALAVYLLNLPAAARDF